jgi:hypothetical protein
VPKQCRCGRRPNGDSGGRADGGQAASRPNGSSGGLADGGQAASRPNGSSGRWPAAMTAWMLWREVPWLLYHAGVFGVDCKVPCSAGCTHVLRAPMRGPTARIILQAKALLRLRPVPMTAVPSGVVFLSEGVIVEISLSPQLSCDLRVKTQALWSGRRQHLCRYLLEGVALESLTCGATGCGSCVGLLCGRGKWTPGRRLREVDVRRGGGLGWLCGNDYMRRGRGLARHGWCAGAARVASSSTWLT